MVFQLQLDHRELLDRRHLSILARGFRQEEGDDKRYGGCPFSFGGRAYARTAFRATNPSTELSSRYPMQLQSAEVARPSDGHGSMPKSVSALSRLIRGTGAS